MNNMTREELVEWMRNVASRGKVRLTREQRYSNVRWVNRQDPTHASLLQIGANAHRVAGFRTTPGTYDVGPDCVSRGWRATLVEPMPNIFAQLAARYPNGTVSMVKSANAQSDRLNLVRGAVCDSCSTTPLMQMWYVDVSTNYTGSWGSAHADNRCISSQHGPSGILSEISSLSLTHLLKQEAYFKTSRRSCARCSERLGRQLPPNCLSHVVRRNLRSLKVACYCPSDLVPSPAGHASIVRGEKRSLTLLLVDAEGYDASVLRQFPFESVHVSRISFEAQHLPDRVFQATGELLRTHGFEFVYGGFKAPLSTWHHINSTA